MLLCAPALEPLRPLGSCEGGSRSCRSFQPPQEAPEPFGVLTSPRTELVDASCGRLDHGQAF
jgi:hypothetical protein